MKELVGSIRGRKNINNDADVNINMKMNCVTTISSTFLIGPSRQTRRQRRAAKRNNLKAENTLNYGGKGCKL